MNALTKFKADLEDASGTTLKDPSKLGYPPTLPLELALAESPVKAICENYGLTKQDYLDLRDDPNFVAAVQGYLDELQKEGMSFKLKARLQAEAMLQQSWKMVHDKSGLVPPSVKADLIKFTVRCAGLSDEKKDAPGAGGIGTALQINIHLE